MPVSAPLARVLTAGRGHFNQRVLEARRRYPALDPAAFAGFVEAAVDPLVMRVAARHPERTTMLVVAAFDAALQLAGNGHLAGRSPGVTEVWRTLAPAIAQHVADDPQAVLGALSNAAITLCQHPGARWAEWLAEMARLAPTAASWNEVRTLGQVLAWRAGLAHYRQGALAAAEALPEALALQAVGAPASASWPAVRAALSADPWLVPAGAGASDGPARQVGGFVGFGGPFAFPPQVGAVEDGFVITSGERSFHLLADAFGVALLPTARGEAIGARIQPGRGGPTVQGQTLTSDGQRVHLDLPEDGIAVAANAHTLAVSSPYSYAVRLFPRRQKIT
jgi:hypothetical protein